MGLKPINLSIWLIVQIQQQPIGDLPYGNGTKSQEPLEHKASISSSMSCRHPGCESASLIILGIETEDTEDANA